MIRRLVPFAVLPVTLLAVGLASSPWLRAFPSDVMAAPLFGAAALSVLVPLVTVRLLSCRLWLTSLVDVGAFVIYTLLVVLHEPTRISDLVGGLVRGPSQLLTFALPLVSPRTLLVAPVALCWLSGAIAGECQARRWATVLPFFALLVTFGLAYAGTVRAASGSPGDVRASDTWLAVGLLVVLLLLRVAQSWVQQESTAETTQADSVLPLRGLVVGTVTTLLVASLAAVGVQSSVFAGRARTPQRVPSVNNSQPLSPVAFIAGLRPSTANGSGVPVFHVSLDRTAPAYFGIANVDFYDGDGWAFNRSFRPSGGILPLDTDPALNAVGPALTQRYRIDAGPLTSAPWMPYLERPQRVTDTTVNIDAGSGMVVPSTALRSGQSYTVRSQAPVRTLAQLPATVLPATSAPPTDTQIPGALRATLGTVVSAFVEETHTPSSPPVPFLQALGRDLQSKYALAGSPAASPSAFPSASPAPKPKPKAKPGNRAAPSRSAAAPARVGGVSFADVLASIIGPQRAATPEQYATLFALVARQLGVPARLATGFRVPSPTGGQTLDAGSYAVTTADAWTWVEIPVRGSGWVVIDPAPSSYSDSQRASSAGAQPSRTPSATPSQNALVTQANGGHAVAPRSAVPQVGAASHHALIRSLLIAVGVLLVALLLAPTLGRRLRARRRRSASDPRHRLLGAWHESLDMLTESGLRGLANLTSAEIVTATGQRFGPESAGRAADLGHAADAVIYSSTASVGVAEADSAWRAHVAMRQLVRRRLGIRGRLARGLRYHRSH